LSSSEQNDVQVSEMAEGIEIGHCAVREELQSLCLLGYSLQTKVNRLLQKKFHHNCWNGTLSSATTFFTAS
jgi:hypothetical protein